MDKNDFEKGIKNIFSGLLDTIADNAKQNQLYLALVKTPEVFKDYDHFFSFVKFELEQIATQAIQTVKGVSANGYAQTFYHGHFIECQIERLVTELEGHGCCHDKSSHIVRQYLHFLATGEKKLWETERYWVPKFGSQDDWFDFAKACLELYYGRPKNYFTSYKKLYELGYEEAMKRKQEKEQ